jgi:pimeloyl-ACP methyl ester carboxylesterase
VPTTKVNGVELYYELEGSGDPLVLVHGSWGDHTTWEPLVDALDGSFRTLVFDRRGHSDSERPPGQGSVEEDVDDVAALIEQLDLAPAHVLGNSFGAAISLRLAIRRPELLRSLLAHEPPVFPILAGEPEMQPVLQEVQSRVQAVVALLEAGDFEVAARQFVETVALGPGAWENELTPELRQVFVFNAPTFLDETRDPQALMFDLDALPRFDGPALLTDGDQSPPFFPVVVGKLAERLPRAQRRTLAGTGHVPQLSHPAEYAQVIREFTSAAG